MMQMASLLTFDCGSYPAPASLVAAMETMPTRMRQSTFSEEPLLIEEVADPAFWKWFESENTRCTAAYMAGEDFKPSEYASAE